MAELHVDIEIGEHGLLPAQEAIVDSCATIRVLLGGLGSGKTQGGALAFLLHCLRNNHTPDYGRGNPISMVVSSTVSVLRDSALQALESCAPKN